MSLDFSANYDASFKGTGFWEQYEGGFSPTGELLTDTAELRIPGSDTTVIQSFGQATRTVDLPIAINESDVAALLAKRGQTGTLIYHAGTTTAFFKGVTNSRKTAHDLDIYNMTLRFIL